MEIYAPLVVSPSGDDTNPIVTLSELQTTFVPVVVPVHPDDLNLVIRTNVVDLSAIEDCSSTLAEQVNTILIDRTVSNLNNLLPFSVSATTGYSVSDVLFRMNSVMLSGDSTDLLNQTSNRIPVSETTEYVPCDSFTVGVVYHLPSQIPITYDPCSSIARMLGGYSSLPLQDTSCRIAVKFTAGERTDLDIHLEDPVYQRTGDITTHGNYIVQTRALFPDSSGTSIVLYPSNDYTISYGMSWAETPSGKLTLSAGSYIYSPHKNVQFLYQSNIYTLSDQELLYPDQTLQLLSTTITDVSWTVFNASLQVFDPCLNYFVDSLYRVAGDYYRFEVGYDWEPYSYVLLEPTMTTEQVWDSIMVHTRSTELSYGEVALFSDRLYSYPDDGYEQLTSQSSYQYRLYYNVSIEARGQTYGFPVDGLSHPLLTWVIPLEQLFLLEAPTVKWADWLNIQLTLIGGSTGPAPKSITIPNVVRYLIDYKGVSYTGYRMFSDPILNRQDFVWVFFFDLLSIPIGAWYVRLVNPSNGLHLVNELPQTLEIRDYPEPDVQYLAEDVSGIYSISDVYIGAASGESIYDLIPGQFSARNLDLPAQYRLVDASGVHYVNDPSQSQPPTPLYYAFGNSQPVGFYALEPIEKTVKAFSDTNLFFLGLGASEDPTPALLTYASNVLGLTPTGVQYVTLSDGITTLSGEELLGIGNGETITVVYNV